jgi:hypothetical protein
MLASDSISQTRTPQRKHLNVASELVVTDVVDTLIDDANHDETYAVDLYIFKANLYCLFAKLKCQFRTMQQPC